MDDLNTKGDLNRVQNFVNKYADLGVYAASFRLALENIDLNIQWMERNYQIIKNWFEFKKSNSEKFT